MKRRFNTIWNRKIPSLIGFSFVVLSLIAIAWLSSNTVLFGTKAATGNLPKNVKISNISDSAFTVSYLTDERVTGTVIFGTDEKFGRIAMDDRDKLVGLGTPAPHKVHHITLQQLDPSKKYYFSIVSGSSTFTNNTKPYEVTTGPLVNEKPALQPPMAGKVMLEDNSIPSEALAYVSSSDSQLFSTLLKPDGSYMLPLNNLRKTDLSAVLTLTQDSMLHLNIISPAAQSDITLKVNQINPIPLIILAKNYNFAVNNLPITPSPAASASEGSALLPEYINTTPAAEPQIFTPKTDQKFKDQQPEFHGKAVPNSEVEIIIESDQKITTTVVTDEYGNWEYRPPVKLKPGNHSITISSMDELGELKKIFTPFTVHASGNQFTEIGISPAPTVAVTPAATETPFPTIIFVTPTTNLPPPPTMTPIPTPIPTIGPSIVVTTSNPDQNGSSQNQTNNPRPPNSGNPVTTAGMILGGVLFISGAVLFFLSRGGISP